MRGTRTHVGHTQLCAIEVVAHHNLQLTINSELASSYSDTVWNVAYFQTQFGMIKLEPMYIDFCFHCCK